jgi:Ca2+-binding RTX toxin-like protein
MLGGASNEFFAGGSGSDIMTGGGGADHFVFLALRDSTVAGAGRDLIADFSHGQHDRIDLSQIDAKAATVGTDDAFHLIGMAAFGGHAGELRCWSANSHTFISGDVDGDKRADFEIELGSHVTLTNSDFIL